MAKESGIATPNAEDLVRFDRKRKGKKLSNDDWTSKTDAEAKIARMKDGTTHLAYKPEHAVDLDTGVIVAAPIHEADKGDTTTLGDTLETRRPISRLSASRRRRTILAKSSRTKAITRARF
jgi:transposase